MHCSSCGVFQHQGFLSLRRSVSAYFPRRHRAGVLFRAGGDTCLCPLIFGSGRDICGLFYTAQHILKPARNPITGARFSQGFSVLFWLYKGFCFDASREPSAGNQ